MPFKINEHNFVPKDIYKKSDLEGLESWTLADNKGVDSKGRNYEVYTKEIVHKDFGWKFAKGLQALAATVFSLGLAAIFSKKVQTLWREATSGIENRKIKVLSELTKTADKTSNVHQGSGFGFGSSNPKTGAPEPVGVTGNRMGTMGDFKPMAHQGTFAPTKDSQPTTEQKPTVSTQKTESPPLSEAAKNVNAELESIRNTIINEVWLKRNELSEKDADRIDEMVKKAKQRCEDLPKPEMKLHFHSYRFGFSYCYGEIPGENKFVPIEWIDSEILMAQVQKESDGTWWPIKDPQNNTYFSPKTTVEKHYPISGSSPTMQDLLDQVRMAEIQGPSSESYRILEALLPYAKFMKEGSPNMYNRIRVLIPAYPENPV